MNHDLSSTRLNTSSIPSRIDFVQELKKGQHLVVLPKQCQLTYDDESKPELLGLIEQVPRELWGARLALQVCSHLNLLYRVCPMHL